MPPQVALSLATSHSNSSVATYSYDEFGNLTSSTGTLYNPLRYSGANNAYFDSETGLYKMGARYYKPEIGRWITRDSYTGEQEEPQSQNRYVYVENDPANRVDPTGRWDREWHRRWTYSQAKALGFSEFYAKQLGVGARWPDTVFSVVDAVSAWFYNPWDTRGDWLRWHFDMQAGSGLKNDSRFRQQVTMLHSAIRYVSYGKKGYACQVMGRGVHAYPGDYVAHGFISPLYHWPFWYLTGSSSGGLNCDNTRWQGMPGWPCYGDRVGGTNVQTRKRLRYFKTLWQEGWSM